MLLLFVSCVVIATSYAATTVPPTTGTVLYDMSHHKAMIVRADGCYEYNLNHQDRLDAADATKRPMLEARMLAELATAINIQEVGNHHLSHLTQDIQTACAAIPVYSWDIPPAVIVL